MYAPQMYAPQAYAPQPQPYAPQPYAAAPQAYAPQGPQLSASQAATAQRSQAPVFAPLEESTGVFVESGPAFSLTACVGVVVLASAVTVFGNPGRRYRRVWRRKVRSQWFGRKAFRSDKRPELFLGVKDPKEPKKIYHYYANKMYKVIREAIPEGHEEAQPDIEV